MPPHDAPPNPVPVWPCTNSAARTPSPGTGMSWLPVPSNAHPRHWSPHVDRHARRSCPSPRFPQGSGERSCRRRTRSRCVAKLRTKGRVGGVVAADVDGVGLAVPFSTRRTWSEWRPCRRRRARGCGCRRSRWSTARPPPPGAVSAYWANGTPRERHARRERGVRPVARRLHRDRQPQRRAGEHRAEVEVDREQSACQR